MHNDKTGGVRDSCWDLDEFAADCAAAHFAEVCAYEGANRAGEIEGDCGQHQPGRGHSVESAGFEGCADAVRVEEGALSVAFERVQFRDPANGPAPGDAFADLP